MKFYHSLTAGILAVSLLCSQAVLTAFAEDTVIPANLDSAVCESLLQENSWNLDLDNDGIISAEEARNCTSLYLSLEHFTEINWLTEFPDLTYISFTGGTLTDFSVLKQLPKLRNLSFSSVPLTDIDFLKDLNLESCHLDDMEQITLEQKIAVMHWQDYALEAGYSADIEISPIGLLDNYSMKMTIDDESVAEFTYYSGYGQFQEIYAVKPGSTAYHFYVEEQEVASGSITVSDLQYQNPALENPPAENFRILDSHYYGTTHAVLRDGVIYGIQGGTVKPMQEPVKDYDFIYLKNAEGSYQYADIALLEDGTLLVNQKEISELRFTEVENGCAITEDHEIYTLCPDGTDFVLLQIPYEFKSFPYESKRYYTSQSGEVIYYKTSYDSSGKPVLSNTVTKIKNPVMGYSDMFIDENHVLWVCKTYPSFTATKTAENVTEIGYYPTKSGGYTYGYLTADGKAYRTGNQEEFELGEAVPEIHSYEKSGGFYLHAYTLGEEAISENNAGVDWYLTPEQILTLHFNQQYFAISEGYEAITAEYDEETKKGYVYFLRTDGSIWQYCIETQDVQKMTAENSEITSLAGDANGDGIFDVKDIITLQRWLLHDGTSLPDWKACDFTEDQQINIFDLIMMKRKLLNA